ncbi:hypothetical protein AB0A67_34815, partial [Streptomyces eurythermus]
MEAAWGLAAGPVSERVADPVGDLADPPWGWEAGAEAGPVPGGPAGSGPYDDLWRPGGLGDPALVQAVLSSAMPEAQRSRALYLLGLALAGPMRAAAVVVAEPAALPEALRSCAAGLLAPPTRAGGPAPQAVLSPTVLSAVKTAPWKVNSVSVTRPP